MTLSGTAVERRRAALRAGWVAAHRPVAGVPRGVRLAAYAVPFTVLPSSLWRIAVCTFHAPVARRTLTADLGSSGIPGLPLELYVVLLSIASELLAFTAVGLVAGWGEVFPRWIPGLRGHRVPVGLAVIPGAAAAIGLTVLSAWVAISYPLAIRVDGSAATDQRPLGFGDWQGVLAVIAYAPLLLWGPLLGLVTINYRRRRRDSVAR
ncbi:MAG TPA: hypothetical protein VHC49_00755 [Mycobacteriales bacterium]|nr:hypothetical protein [Mycobacteriales bacterium]